MRNKFLAIFLVFALSYMVSAFSFPEYVPCPELVAFESDTESVKYASPDTKIIAIFTRQEITDMLAKRQQIINKQQGRIYLGEL